MCGRYAFSRIEKQLIERLGLRRLPDWLARRYNIAPSQRAPVCVTGEDGAPELQALQWGLVPAWAKDPAQGAKLINARSESAAEKPSFRDAWRERRCLVPCDGWYEWTKSGRERQPWFIQHAAAGMSVFAGLWEPPAACLEPMHPGSFTILTCEAAPAIRLLHHRMPVLLDPAAAQAWLAGELDAAKLAEVAWSRELRWHRVSPEVNRVGPDHAGLMDPCDAGQGGLFGP